MAKKIIKKLNISEEEYRKTLSILRTKINIVEKNLSNKDYESIKLNEVPAKAMLKYSNTFDKYIHEKYLEYKENVKNGNEKINTKGLMAYEIVKKVIADDNADTLLLDLMWNNQKDIFHDCKTNVLVMADTSGSMTMYDGIPYATSVGLALYTAERNKGIFHNYFITFDSEPHLYEIKGNNIKEKIENIPSYYESTNIDKAFKLLLDSAVSANIKQEELPSHLLIISDMEFDMGVYSENKTNFSGWKKAFKDAGYILPKIIFWNVSCDSRGLPVTKFDKDVCLVSGFSINILDNLLNLENYSPEAVMLEKLLPYKKMLS